MALTTRNTVHFAAVAEAQLTGPVRHCSGCGATVVFDGPGLSTTCSYCDAPMVDEARAVAAVDAIVPFRVPERGALERLRMHLEGRRWAPSELRRLRVHSRGLRGVLVPFWVYDGTVRSEYRGEVGIHWYRTQTYVDERGKRQSREVRETQWLPVSGTAAREISDHVVSASVGLPAHEANSLEPFDLGCAAPFDPRLLSGFEAELPSISTADAEQLAIASLREAEGPRVLRELLPGDVNRLDAIASRVEIRGRRMVLLPVWIASYHHGDQQAALRLLVNGQTGEVVGRVPVSRAKVALALAVALALVGALALLAWWIGGRS